MEVVKDGEIGFVVPVGDVVVLREMIKYLLKNEGLREGMGEAGRRDMVKRYEREKVMSKLKDIYESLATNK